MTGSRDDEIIAVLRQVVPEPDPSPGRAERARRQAARIRLRRRATVSCVAAVAALAVAVPVFLTSTGGRGGDDVAVPPEGELCSAGSCDPETVLAALRRPLDLPSVADGEACPVSPTRRLPGGAGFSGPFPASGAGPLYLAGQPAVALSDVPDTADPPGWLSQKVIWVVDQGYTGPLLLRGARIDEPGGLRFSHYLGALGYPGTGSGDGKAHPELAYLRQDVAESEPPALDSYPSAVYVQGPGCYAVQVDGVDVSETLVFRVLPPS